MRKFLKILLLCLSIIFFTHIPGFAQQNAYVYKIIAKTGSPIIDNTPLTVGSLGPVLDLSQGPSINDAGKVAFWAKDLAGAGGGHILLENNGNIERNEIINALQVFSEGVEVNNVDQVTFHYGTTFNNDKGIVRIDHNPSSGPNPLIANNFFTGSPFVYIVNPVSLNNLGRVVFTADPVTGGTVLANRDSGSASYFMTNPVSGFPTFYPTIANNNQTVVRAGGTTTSPLYLFLDHTLSNAFIVANTAMGFTNISDKPGLSNNGVFISFLAIHSTQGTGIFANIPGLPNFKIVSVGGASPLLSLNGATRISVNLSPDSGPNVYRTAYIGQSSVSPNPIGLYTTDVDISNTANIVIGAPTLVIKIGDTIPGLTGTVSSLNVYDALNAQGELVFWVQMSTGIQAIIRATERRCSNMVQWPNGVLIKNAVIEAYYFTGSAVDPQINTSTQTGWTSTINAADGTFCFPKKLTDFSSPPVGELLPAKRGIRTKVTYTADTGVGINNKTYTIINYPEWDPFRPLRKSTVGPVTIEFPYPVFFQPGMNGGVNVLASDKKINAFLTLNSGASNSEISSLATTLGLTTSEISGWVAIKRGDSNNKPLPAFVYFTIPSKASCFGNPSDNVIWGFDNCALQSATKIGGSATAINQHFITRIQPVMTAMSPNNEWQKVPFNVAGHSLGGVISREWISKKFAYPKINRYVTFDAPHGGLSYASSIFGRIDDFWNELHMNGKSNINGTPPPNDLSQGWNYERKLESDGNQKDRLFYSSINNFFITPEVSPFGIGRIMKPATFVTAWNFFGAFPNGYCERFLHGWNLNVANEGHSIQNVPHVFVSAAKFFAIKDPQPTLGTPSNPNANFLTANLATGTGNQCPGLPAVNDPIKAKKRYRLESSAGLNTAKTLRFNANEMLSVRALVTKSSATLAFLNNVGVPFVRMNEVIENLDGRGFIVSFDMMMGSTGGSNGGQIRLTAGSTDAAAYVEVVAINSTYQASAGSVNQTYVPGNNVTVRSQILNSTGGVTNGTANLAETTITLPTGAQITQTAFDDGAHDDLAAGDGVYGTIFNNLTERGNYLISGDVSFTQAGGTELSRTASGLFTINSNAVTANGVTAIRFVNTGGSSLNEFIEIDLSINVVSNGSYRILPSISIGGNVVEDQIVNFTETGAPVNNRIVTLRIPSSLLHQSGSAGPITVGNLNIYDADRSLFLASIPNYITPAYSLSSFELPQAPQLFSANPSYAPHAGGATIQLHGTNLRNVTQVFFGTQQAVNFTVINNEVISVVVPAWNGSIEEVEMRVVTPWNEGRKTYIFQYSAVNQAPQIAAIPNKTVVAGTLLTFNVSATDPNNDPIVLSSDAGVGSPLSSIGATFINNGNGTGVFNWTPTLGQAGLYSVRIIAVDPGNLTDIKIVGITVNPPIPTITIGTNMLTYTPSNLLDVFLDITPATPPQSVDVYVALDVDPGPGLMLFFITPSGLTTVPGAYSAGLNVGSSNIHIPIFTNFPLTGIPPQIYTWYAAIMQPGTLNIIGNISVRTITLTP